MTWRLRVARSSTDMIITKICWQVVCRLHGISFNITTYIKKEPCRYPWNDQNANSSLENTTCDVKGSFLKTFLTERYFTVAIWCILGEIALRWKPQDVIEGKSTVGPGNGWMQSGIKPLPEPMLTQSNDIIWYHNTHELLFFLTHRGLVTPYGDTDLDQHWLR